MSRYTDLRDRYNEKTKERASRNRTVQSTIAGVVTKFSEYLGLEHHIPSNPSGVINSSVGICKRNGDSWDNCRVDELDFELHPVQFAIRVSFDNSQSKHPPSTVWIPLNASRMNGSGIIGFPEGGVISGDAKEDHARLYEAMHSYVLSKLD